MKAVRKGGLFDAATFCCFAFNGLAETCIPLFPVLSYERITEEFINRYVQPFSQLKGGLANVPLVVVHGVKIIVFTDPYRIEMTGNRFPE